MEGYYITVYQPICGWKAVLKDNEHNPIQTGFYAYDDKEEAIKEAKHWSECDEIPYYDESEVK
jgi:hypothetical protein